MSILNQIADFTKKRVYEAKKKEPLNYIKKMALSMLDNNSNNNFCFENALKKVIYLLYASAKKRHPQKG